MSKDRLRPTREVVKQVIADTVESAAGPDAVPFEIYKKGGEATIDLFLEFANDLLD